MALSLRAYIKLVFVTELSYFHPNVFLITVPLPTTLFLPPWCLRCEMPRGWGFFSSLVCNPAVNTRPALGIRCCQILPETRPPTGGGRHRLPRQSKGQVKAVETSPCKRASSRGEVGGGGQTLHHPPIAYGDRGKPSIPASPCKLRSC